jgi:hypothetical protein
MVSYHSDKKLRPPLWVVLIYFFLFAPFLHAQTLNTAEEQILFFTVFHRGCVKHFPDMQASLDDAFRNLESVNMKKFAKVKSDENYDKYLYAISLKVGNQVVSDRNECDRILLIFKTGTDQLPASK